MTPALKAMVEAMVAELHRQIDEDPSRPGFVDNELEPHEVQIDGTFDLEKVARAGLAASPDALARALCVADGEDPEDFHTKADREAADRGAQLTDHAVPLWMSYRARARRAIDAILKETP